MSQTQTFGQTPLGGKDSSGLDCGWSSPWDCGPALVNEAGSLLSDGASGIQNGIKAAAPVLNVVADVAGKVSGVAGAIGSGCAAAALVTSETGAGAAIFGTCSVVANGISLIGAGVQTLTDATLAVAGQCEAKNLTLDATGWLLTAHAGSLKALFGGRGSTLGGFEALPMLIPGFLGG